jgi:hypothetical protein
LPQGAEIGSFHHEHEHGLYPKANTSGYSIPIQLAHVNNELRPGGAGIDGARVARACF